MKMLTDNLVYPPQADPRRNLFSLLTSNFSLPLLCAYKLNMPNKPKTHQKRTKNEKKRTKTNQNERKQAKFHPTNGISSPFQLLTHKRHGISAVQRQTHRPQSQPAM